MQLPPAPVLLLALFVVLFAAFGRHRTTRPRGLAEIGGFMSSSYAADQDGDDPAEAEPGEGAQAALAPASERSPARHVWADTGTWPTEPIVVEPPAAAPAPSVVADPAPSVVVDPEPAAVADPEPFEYPEPTSLEQRAALVDRQGDDSDADHTAMEAATQMRDDTREPEMLQTNEPENAPELQRRALHAVAGSSRGRDALTGMLDRDAFDEVTAQEGAREQRYGHPATVIVFELDGLARLVDRLGTEPGDRIEVALADAITRLARRADHAARLDRGRYAVLLPETDEVAAINYVERVRRACELWLESGAIAMRLSIGWASTNGDAGLSGAIRVATDRMRQEQRRTARGLGDVVPDLELIDGDGPTQAAAGL